MKNDSDLNEIAQNLNSSNKEKSEKSALAILRDIRKKIEEIGDPPYANQNQIKGKNQFYLNSLFCSVCLLPIQNGDFAYYMNCCDSLCHISCLAKIAEFDKSTMAHQCPNCCKDFPTDLIQKLRLMQQILDSIHAQI